MPLKTLTDSPISAYAHTHYHHTFIFMHVTNRQQFQCIPNLASLLNVTNYDLDSVELKMVCQWWLMVGDCTADDCVPTFELNDTLHVQIQFNRHN